MKIQKISWSQWGSGDEDLSGVRFYPFTGEDSGIMGETRYSWAEAELYQRPIQKIHVYNKHGSDSYMRGFEILYRDGTTQNINSINGEIKGTVDFGPDDILVGMTWRQSSFPKQIGIMVMRKR